MRKRSTARIVNGFVSALAVAFFVAHSLLGSLEGIMALRSPAEWVMWIGMAIVLVHVVTSIVTSYGQLADADFPPSARKKRHLALKWATGAVLAGLAIAHVVCVRTFGPDAVQVSVVAAAMAILLVVMLAVHSSVGAKSLITDLGLDKKLMLPFRVVVCVLAAVAGCIVLVSVV